MTYVPVNRPMTLTVALSFLAAPLFALPPLSTNEEVTAKLRDARIADEIQSECDDLKPRQIALILEVGKLKSYVSGLGYSSSDVDAFMRDKTERRRIYGLADAYMSERGVTKGDAASYCALGRQEMQDGSLIGSLLRER